MTPATEPMSKRAFTRSVVLAILMSCFGFLAITFPFLTSIGVTQVVGWLLIISGLVQFVHAFQSAGVGHIVWKLLIAAFYFAVGVYLVARPFLGLAGLTLALAAMFFSKSLIDTATYFSTRKSGASGWILVDGIVTLLLSLMIWNGWPATSVWVLGTLVGIGMLWTGITRLMMAVASRRVYRDDRPFQERRAA